VKEEREKCCSFCRLSLAREREKGTFSLFLLFETAFLPLVLHLCRCLFSVRARVPMLLLPHLRKAAEGEKGRARASK
jgi:hypothetical protein